MGVEFKPGAAIGIDFEIIRSSHQDSGLSERCCRACTAPASVKIYNLTTGEKMSRRAQKSSEETNAECPTSSLGYLAGHPQFISRQAASLGMPVPSEGPRRFYLTHGYR